MYPQQIFRHHVYVYVSKCVLVRGLRFEGVDESETTEQHVIVKLYYNSCVSGKSSHIQC